ncbi:TIGR03766 family XrtG-associated glycosyltransferase [Ligilactobacillus acidipiscis]|uniref:TIGR03766 family XrtG-associated glycosyltransferase n=1 Tax=Ligilactobacillus acidipiscis TaxID=89059 RepID=UPI0023FA0036|nr:TIGR03766 family XrtG-associated glycosyltransferase [Ligilactobacillus acidipiscis]WEV56580.1 hypothetical protein OZX66_10175 [Ligilactobacillus acidipiscis]
MKIFNKLYKLGDKTVFILFEFLFLLTFIFAFQSSNLNFLGTTKTTIRFLLVLVILALLLTITKVRNFCSSVFIRHGYLTSLLLLLGVFFLQFQFVHNVSPEIGFDPRNIFSTLHDPNNNFYKTYFSIYPNNLFMLLSEKKILDTFHLIATWHNLDKITLFLVDFSALLNILTIHILKREKTISAIYIHIVWLLLFPMIIVPYTDTWILPAISLYVLCYCVIVKTDLHLALKVFVSLVMGAVIVVSYFLKPSGVIPFIAICLIEFLYLLRAKNYVKIFKLSTWIIALACLLSVSGSYYTINHKISNQKIVAITPGRETPALHFISIGMGPWGGYVHYEEDAMKNLKTIAERKTYSKKMIKKRMHKRGALGYIKFLLQKHSNNTADGSFGWLNEYQYINSPIKRGTTAYKYQKFLYPGGKKVGDFRFVAQLFWLFLLLSILLGFSYQTKFSKVLRLGILGGFLFLLIFEGGRSRYLIQFLPLFLMLASLTHSSARSFLAEIFHQFRLNWQHKIE